MNKLNSLRHVIIGLTVLFTATLLHADETQPKFTIIPTTPTKWVIPSNGNAMVTYTVTNQTKITRTLTMKPIRGITQKTTGVGVCGSTFTLAHGQSCQLVLPLVGTQLSGRITEGPVICKTNGHGDNGPDPFLCSQASRANSLDITSAGVESANISVNPSRLSMIVGPLGLPHSSIITVTNNSFTVTALNITAHLPPTWNSVGNVSSCTAVLPRSTCQIIITQDDTVRLPINVPIYGSNTTQAIVNMAVVTGTADLSVSPPSIILQDGGVDVPVTVTNTSTNGVVAYDVKAYLPQSLSDVGVMVSPSACPPLNPGVTCIFTFKPPASSNAVIPSDGSYLSTPIIGTNTIEASVRVKLEHLQATISVNPLSLVFQNDSLQSQTITVKNISSANIAAENIFLTTDINFSASALHAMFTMTSTDCSAPLPRGGKCTLVFTPIANSGVIGATSLAIQGSNTNIVDVSISKTSAILSWDINSGPIHPSETASLTLATDNIFTPASGVSPAVSSKTRYLTVYNVGTEPAINVTITGIGTLPNGTRLSTSTGSLNSCGSISPGASCIIYIVPGTTPSAVSGAEPTASVLEVKDDYSNKINAGIILLTYGNIYNEGFVYWIDDVDDQSVSVTGRVVARANESPTSVVWNAQPTCNSTRDPATGCTRVPMSRTTYRSEGLSNTLSIVNTLSNANPRSLLGYAAYLCYNRTLLHEWYLPAACELGYDSPTSTASAACGLAGTPTFQNIMSNATTNAIHFSSNSYWSSTVYFLTNGDATNNAWINLINPAPDNAAELVYDKYYVVCAKKF